jgi:hypothetical protein
MVYTTHLPEAKRSLVGWLPRRCRFPRREKSGPLKNIAELRSTFLNRVAAQDVRDFTGIHGSLW